MLNANYILKLTEDDQTQTIIDIFSITASQFIKKLKAIGAEVDFLGKDIAIRGLSVPPECHAAATYRLTFPELLSKNESKTINKLTYELRKNFTSLGPTKLVKSKSLTKGSFSSVASIELYSSRQINIYISDYVVNILKVTVFVPVNELNVINIKIYPSLSFLIYDILRLFRKNKVKEIDIKKLCELISDEILTATDNLVRGLRLLGA